MDRSEKKMTFSTACYEWVASFVVEIWSISNQGAKKLVEKQAQIFEDQKGYFLKIWDKKGGKIK